MKNDKQETSAVILASLTAQHTKASNTVSDRAPIQHQCTLRRPYNVTFDANALEKQNHQFL